MSRSRQARPRPRRLLPALGAAVAIAAAAPAAAEIYRWVDADGRIHFTHHLDEVPLDQRPKAQQGAKERASQPSRMQTYATDGAEALPASAAPGPPGRRGGAGRPVQVAVERAGTGMLVHVRLNDRVTAPFILDTGASDVAIPKAVADELGLRAGPDTRTKAYSTANGVIQEPVVMLDSVDLQGARVENVPASISRSMQIGLLGLSFFNHFTYKIDAAAGIVTLVPNRLAESGLIRGGRSEAQWRAEYANLRSRMAAIDDERTHTPSAHGRELKRLDDEGDALQRQLDQLETEADAARVPVTWRE
jgi:clan AA aspartic protease (TIGR02281 family)